MSGACVASLFKKIAPKNKSGLKPALEFFSHYTLLNAIFKFHFYDRCMHSILKRAAKESTILSVSSSFHFWFYVEEMEDYVMAFSIEPKLIFSNGLYLVKLNGL